MDSSVRVVIKRTDASAVGVGELSRARGRWVVDSSPESRRAGQTAWKVDKSVERWVGCLVERVEGQGEGYDRWQGVDVVVRARDGAAQAGTRSGAGSGGGAAAGGGARQCDAGGGASNAGNADNAGGEADGGWVVVGKEAAGGRATG